MVKVNFLLLTKLLLSGIKQETEKENEIRNLHLISLPYWGLVLYAKRFLF